MKQSRRVITAGELAELGRLSRESSARRLAPKPARDESRRTESITVRVTPREAYRVEQAHRALGISRSEYVLRALSYYHEAAPYPARCPRCGLLRSSCDSAGACATVEP